MQQREGAKGTRESPGDEQLNPAPMDLGRKGVYWVESESSLWIQLPKIRRKRGKEQQENLPVRRPLSHQCQTLGAIATRLGLSPLPRECFLDGPCRVCQTQGPVDGTTALTSSTFMTRLSHTAGWQRGLNLNPGWG